MADKKKNKSALAEFEALLNAQGDCRKGFSPGERVRATVIGVNSEYGVMDVGGKHEGLVASEEFRDAEGHVTIKAGDEIDLIFMAQQNGALIFTTRVGAMPIMDQTLAEAQASGLPVEGVVQSEVNGGYEVALSGKRAFCPYSQMSLFRTEGAAYIGQKLPFVVVEYGEDGRNIVLSRRALLEREREARREALRVEIQPGQVRTGTVSRLTEFGIFVDLGGLDGLIPIKEISWQRGVKPADVAKPGDRVEVLVRETDWERNRVSLSLRGAQGDPWDGVVARHGVGSLLRGKVSRLERFGAFVEIVPGVEGLIPIGRLGGGRRIVSAREVVSEGQEIDVRIESIDAERRRISLSPLDNRVAALKQGEPAPGVDIDDAAEYLARNPPTDRGLGSLGDVFSTLNL